MMRNRTNKGRREFLVGTLAGAGALAVGVPSASAAAEAEAESRCEIFSLTDNLADYIRSVDAVAADILSRSLLSVSVTLDECIALHKELAGYVTRLEAALEGATGVAEVREVRELCEVCGAGARQVKASLNTPGQDARPLASALVTLTRQVCDRARKLLPEGKPIPPAAAPILRDIICLVNSERFLQFETKMQGRGGYTEEAKGIIKGINAVRDYLRAARESVMQIESRCQGGDRAAARKDADFNIAVAIEGLRTLVNSARERQRANRAAEPQTRQAAEPQATPVSYLSEDFLKALPSPPRDVNVFSGLPQDKELILPPVDVLIINLVSCKGALAELGPLPIPGGACGPPTVRRDGARGPAPAHAVYTRAVSYAEPEPVPQSFHQVSSLLDSVCPPGSPDQTRQCLKIVSAVRLARRRFTLHDNTCRSLIRNGLGASEWWGSMPLLNCRPNGRREAVVEGLFRML